MLIDVNAAGMVKKEGKSWYFPDESEKKMAAMKSQFEANKTRLETDLADARRENAELQQKVLGLLRLKQY